MLEPLLELLLLHLVLDIRTERHRALPFQTVFSMVATQRDELFANGTSSVGFSLADLRVRHHSLHSLATGQPTVRVSALTSVHQTLDASLDAELSCFLRVGLLLVGRRRSIIQVKTEFLHLVRMAVLLVTLDAEVEVVAHRAMVACFHMAFAVVARVNELVLALVV